MCSLISGVSNAFYNQRHDESYFQVSWYKNRSILQFQLRLRCEIKS